MDIVQHIFALLQFGFNRIIVFFIGVLILCIGCISHPVIDTTKPDSDETRDSTSNSLKTLQKENSVRTCVIEHAKEKLGIRYQNGGSDHRGFDCSGLVFNVYQSCGIRIDRKSQDQYRYGRKIDANEALPGDLVFFKIWNHKISHVGIYLGDNQFIHAPSSGGYVSVSRLDTVYWRSRIIGFATYLDDS